MEEAIKLLIIACFLIIMILIILLSIYGTEPNIEELWVPQYIRSRHNLEYLVPSGGRLFASGMPDMATATWYPVNAYQTAVTGFYNIATRRLITRNGEAVTVGSMYPEDTGTIFNIGYITSNIITISDPNTGLLLTVGDDFFCYMRERLPNSDSGRQQFELEKAT